LISHSEEQLQTYARLAGITYLLIIILGVINSVFIDSKLVVVGDGALTSTNILANDFLFRIGIVAVLVLYAGVVVLSAALYVLLKSVNKALAMLAMLLRIVEATLGIATILISFVVLALLNQQGYSAGVEPEYLYTFIGALLEVRTTGLDLVLFFVGLGGTIFCYLFYASSCIPRMLSAWGIFTYLSMIALACISIITPGHSEALEIILYGAGALFEVTIGLWLLIKGVNFQSPEEGEINEA